MELPKNQKELLNNLEKLISQTYEVEKEFVELKNILNGVIEFLPQALWVVDESGSIIVQNSKAKEFDFIPSPGEIEQKNRYFLVQSSNIKNKTIISATDITEQKRNERLIAMGQMAAHLAHEIRNPIGSISILLSILKKNCACDEIADEMKSALFRVEKIIKSTLLFSKGIQPKIVNFNLKNLQEELKENIKYYSYSKNIKIFFELPEKTIKGDFDLLILVFQNMLFNAIDAIEEDSKEEGTIEIKYRENRNCHIISITDSGKDFENKEILFEAFKSTKTKGNGLGLALSLEILKAHGGKIELNNSQKGFDIYIPKSI